MYIVKLHEYERRKKSIMKVFHFQIEGKKAKYWNVKVEKNLYANLPIGKVSWSIGSDIKLFENCHSVI
jgi:hypothetical protein